MLEHGGRLSAASRRFGAPAAGWVDLSTGINPHPWPVPVQLPVHWARLPDPDDGLLEAACMYYGAELLLPVAGSQAAIQGLPLLRPRSHVGIIAPAYAEHARAWRRAGHAVSRLEFAHIGRHLAKLDALVVVNPGNPTGLRISRAQLLDWHAQLASRGSWLIVDEAFMDPAPQESLMSSQIPSGLIVLRSVGKFFGLAGARVGFVAADARLLRRLGEYLGPWSLAGPSRYVSALALRDRDWQDGARARLRRASRRLADLLAAHGLAPDGGTELFQWVRLAQASLLHALLADRGIWTRCFSRPAGLRFGLPGDETQWCRLDQALAEGLAVLPAPGAGA